MADQTMTGSRQFRLAMLAALEGLTLSASAVPVDSPGDWNSPPESLPRVLVRAGNGQEHKMPWNRGQPNYTTTTPILVVGRVAAFNAAACQDALEALQYAIEQAVLTNVVLIEDLQQVPVSVEWEITAEGEYHFGRVVLTFAFEFPEVFEPVVRDVFQQIDLHADLLGTFDATGTYANPAFPAAVVPAPRTSGPDGRDEGGLEIILPT